MRIIYLHQYFNTPSMSGGTRSYEMAKRMVKAGHEVHMVTSRVDGKLHGRSWIVEEIEGIQVHWLPVQYDNSMGYSRRLLAFMNFAARAGGYAAKLGGDLIFASSTPLTIAIPGVLASRKSKAPMVFEVRDLWPEVPYAMGALRLPFSLQLAKKLESWAYRNSTAVVGLSPGMCEGIARTGFPSNRVYCIPNSADLDLFQLDVDRVEDVRGARSWLGERPLVLYAGTFGKVNGIEYMVYLAQAMLEVNAEIRFLAVGRGSEWEKIKELASSCGVLGKNFFMEPAVPKRQIANLFASATVCASWVIDVPALWNNSANKVFDAMAAGKPVVINHEGWQKDLLEGEGMGLALPPNDYPASARLLNDFIQDTDKVKEAGQASLRLAETQFSRDELAGKLMEVLEDAAQRYA